MNEYCKSCAHDEGDIGFCDKCEYTYMLRKRGLPPIEYEAKPKPVTNADHIRAMTDKELAEWLDTITAKAQAYGYECADSCPDEYPLLEDWLPWLKEEAEA